MPFESVNDIEMMRRDRTGSNIGNLVYQYSVIRTLMTEDNELVSDNYVTSPHIASEINDNYDAYVIPLADAFRNDFREHLRNYTKLINNLTIPVYVIGVGIRAPFEPKLNEGYAFDKDVKDFVAAVLNKSQMLGLRGQITSDYLTRLGFKAGEEHRVIGCPSMYTFGRKIKIRDVKLDNNSKLSINASNVSADSAMDFLNKISYDYPNHCFVPQVYPELFLGYVGGPSLAHTAENYPYSILSDYYQSGKVKFFLNAPSWFEYMGKIDLSIGTRLHGNIVATINGTPNITIVKDARMRELAEFHKSTSINQGDLIKYRNMRELFDNVDLKSAETVASENFDNFIDFLDKNNINHIYKHNPNRIDAPLDELVINKEFATPVLPITAISNQEKYKRLNIGLDIQKIKFGKNKLAAVNKEKNKYKTLEDKLKNILNIQ